MESLDVDAVRRLIGVSRDEMTDDDIRAALARLSVEHDSDASADEAVRKVRRVVTAIGRLPDEPGERG